MSLSVPWLLVPGLLVLGALVTGVLVTTRRRSAAFAAAGVAVRGGTQWGRWLSVIGLGLLVVALTGPTATLPVGRQAGTVILAMDVSNSMAATDVDPTRLAVAQQAARAFITAQPDNVDIGVVGFDQGALTTSLPGSDRVVTTAAIDTLRPAGGTSLSAAILGSLTAITGQTVVLGEDGSLPDIGYWSSATVVLFSDGEDLGQRSSDQAVLAATVAQNAGIHIETVGVGTASGAAVEVDGYQLHTALDEQLLTAIAATTGGGYHPASDAAQINGIGSSIDLRLTVADQDVPLAGALLIVALALVGCGAVLTVARTGRLV